MVKELEINGDKIVLGNPRGKHTKKALKLLGNITSGDEEVKNLGEYLDYLEVVASECSEINGEKLEKDAFIEYLDDLYDDDKNKILSFYQDKTKGRIDFMKSLQEQQS